MIRPGFGIISQVVATFRRKPIFGYLGMAYAMMAIAGIGVVVSHHMFTVGMTSGAHAYFRDPNLREHLLVDRDQVGRSSSTRRCCRRLG